MSAAAARAPPLGRSAGAAAPPKAQPASPLPRRSQASSPANSNQGAQSHSTTPLPPLTSTQPMYEAKTSDDSGGAVRSQFAPLAQRFDGFESELSLSRHRRKAEEDQRLLQLQTQLNNLQQSLALESKNRAMSVKALQNWLTDRISQWTVQIEGPMHARLEGLGESLSQLSARLDSLEARQKEDREIFPKLVDGRCAELLNEISTLKTEFAQNVAQREEKEKRILLKLQHESNRIAVQFAQDKQVSDDKLRQLRTALDEEVSVRARGAEMVKQTLLEEVAAIKAELAAESSARESADEELVAAVNHYSAALQDGIKIVSTQ